MTLFHPLTVTGVRRDTRDSVVLTLSPPPDRAEKFQFTQGQYLTLRTHIDGEEVRRSYSICAAPFEKCLRIGVKHAAGGLFSTWANRDIGPGAVIEAMAPMGAFHMPLDAGHARTYAGFAAGSGITPLISIIKAVLREEAESRFILFYGNRASSTIMFREELEDLKNENLTRLSIIHILSREHQDIDLLNGRLTREKCDALLERWIGGTKIDAAFICGPQSMMHDVSESLAAHGLDRKNIKFELFAAAGAPDEKRAARAEAAAQAHSCRATIIIHGLSRSFDFQKNTRPVLEAGLAEGLELPFACKAGVCSSCRAKLIEGEVDMDANFALEDYEIARGYILTCQSYPVTDRIVVDYDK